jgi:two-component system, NtrC family, response regulator
MLPSPPSPSTAVGPLRILVVEDENLIRWAVAETLTEAGHVVVEAPDAATALRAVAQTSEPFDVVLLDFRLPDSDDLTLVERIRQQAPASALVMMTAHGTRQMAEDAKTLGVYEVIAKPFDVHLLEEVIVKAYQSKTH